MMRMISNLLIVNLFGILLFQNVAFGQNTNDAKPRKTQLSFEDELIKGGISSPDLLYILKSKNVDYGRLLKLRDNFIPEMRQTKHDILRGTK